MALSLALTPTACAPRYQVVLEQCTETGDGNCGWAFDALSRQEPARVRAVYERVVSTRQRECEWLRSPAAAPRSLEPEFVRRKTAALDNCIGFAALRLGAGETPVDSMVLPPAAAHRDVLAPDFREGVTVLEFVCGLRRSGDILYWGGWNAAEIASEACWMLGDLARASNDARAEEYFRVGCESLGAHCIEGAPRRERRAWLTADVRVLAARHELSGLGSDATPESELAALERIASLLEGLSRPDAEELRASVEPRRGRSMGVAAEAALTGLAAQVEQGHGFDALLPALREANARIEVLRGDERASMRARRQALLDRVLDRATAEDLARHAYTPVVALIDRALQVGDREALGRRRGEVVAAARGFHEEAAGTHAAAGRHGGAVLHAALARTFGSALRMQESERAIERLRTPPWTLRVEGVPCPWAAATPEGRAEATGPATAVVLRWARCESAERQWTTTDTYTYTTTRVTYESRQESYSVSVPTSNCTNVSQQVCRSYPTGTVCNSVLVPQCTSGTTYETRTRTIQVPVQHQDMHTGTRQTERRELRSVATGELLATFGESRVRLPLDASQPELREEQYSQPERHVFTQATLQSQRERAAAHVRGVLRAEGPLEEALRRQEAARRSSLAASSRSGQPAVAEDHDATVLLLIGGSFEGARSAEALQSRYGLPAGAAPTLLRP